MREGCREMQDTSGVHVWLVLVKAFHALAAHGPRRELGRLPACYFVCERNSVVRIRTQIGMSLEVPKRLCHLGGSREERSEYFLRDLFERKFIPLSI